MKKITFILFSIVLISAVSPLTTALSQDSQWVTVEGKAAFENVTKEEARKQAIDNALRSAVEQVVGVEVLAQSLVVDYALSGDIVSAIPHGKVAEWNIVKECIEVNQKDENTPPQLTYKVNVKARVVKESGERDPFFKIKATANRSVYKNEDEVEISITPTKDCYITIFNILQNDAVIELLPNRLISENFIHANETYTFPNDDLKRRGIQLKVFVEEGTDKVAEKYYVLATTQPLYFGTTVKQGIYGEYNGQSAFVTDVIKEIVEIPLSDRAEAFIPYLITR